MSEEHNEDDLEQDQNVPKRLYLFGKDVRAIPCFRDSVLYSLFGGLGSWAATFLLTSSPSKSTKTALLGLILGFYPYSFYCQYKYYTEELIYEELNKTVERQTGNQYMAFDDIESIQAETYG